jgi:phosphoglycolate phosphatase-like HAD superfamily hydrolase
MSSEPLKALLLDLDGTLIEPEFEFTYGEIGRILGPLGHPPPEPETIKRAHARGQLWEWLPEQRRAELVTRFWRDYRGGHYPHPRVLPGVPETLTKLRARGLKLMVVTFRADSDERVTELLTDCDLARYLDGIYSMGELAATSPDKSPIITRALNDFAIHPHEAAIVGDAKPDIESGRVCKLRHAFVVETGGFDYDYLTSLSPDYVLSHIAELPALLERI